MMRRGKRRVTVADLLHDLPLVEVVLALGVWFVSTGRPGQASPEVHPAAPAVLVLVTQQGAPGR